MDIFFHLIEGNLILSPVVELRRPRRLVVGDLLRGFKRAELQNAPRA